MKIFSERLKELRTEKKLLQKDLAIILGTSNSSICDWECGRAQPDMEMIIKIADYFQVTADYLLGRTDV